MIIFFQPGLLGLKGKLGAGMAKSSLQSIGLQLGKQVLNVPSKPTKSVKSMKVRSVSRRTSIVSTEASQAYWMEKHCLCVYVCVSQRMTIESTELSQAY